jgi:hypothetical protein
MAALRQQIAQRPVSCLRRCGMSVQQGRTDRPRLSALVEEVAVALERDQGVAVAGDCLDEFDVGAGGDVAADGGVAEVVETVDGFAVGFGEFGVAECWLLDATVLRRRLV